MNFKVAPIVDGTSGRFVSENNVWEICLRPMLYGVRVGVGKINPDRGFALSYELDYCAGADPAFLMNLFATIVILMSALPEDVTYSEIRELFPSYERKPINQDPCWDRLQELCRMDEPFAGFRKRVRVGGDR
jgi:hypothetical protein